MSTRALVAGASGFIGVHLVRALMERGYEVIALVRRESTGLWRLSSLRQDIRLLYYDDVLSDRRGLDGIRADVCYNLASYGVDYRQHDERALVEGNMMLALDLVTLCKRIGVPRLVHVGSGFEYGSSPSRLTEDSPVRPASLYGAAKAATTHLVMAAAGAAGVRVTVLRPFSVFGPMEGLHRFVPQVMRAVRTGTRLELTPGEQVRDYLFVEDLASAFVLAAERELPDRTIYNVCGDTATSLKDLVRLTCDVVSGDSSVFRFGSLPYRPHEIMQYVGDDSRFRSAVPWTPEHSLESALAATYRWYEAHTHDDEGGG